MQTITIQNIAGFLYFIENTTMHYSHGSFSSKYLLYRGIANKDWDLIPKLYRPEYSKMKRNIDGSVLIEEFREDAFRFIDNYESLDEIEWNQYAQHYGVPTRLLDFSTDPLVALYFYCNSLPNEDGAICVLHTSNYNYWTSKDICFIHNPDKKDVPSKEIIKELLTYSYGQKELSELSSGKKSPFDLNKFNRPQIYFPRLYDARQHAQGSCFLVWGNDIRPFEKMLQIDDYLTVPTDLIENYEKKDINVAGDPIIRDEKYDVLQYRDRFFCKLVIPAGLKSELLSELRCLGKNATTIFPGLDGIGQSICESYLELN